MRPSVYLNCLELVSERDELGTSTLQPVMVADILALEQEIGAQLPESYEEFLSEVGAGHEHGGIGVWFHLDLTRTGNIIEANKDLRSGARNKRPPANFLAVYENHDECVYGFLRNRGGQFHPQVVGFSRESGELSHVADDFCAFLDEISDCSEEELAVAERRLEAAINGSGGHSTAL